MPKFNDLAGRVFGKLTVLSFAGRNADGKSLWNCQCECGNFIIKSSAFFRKGKEFFCGKDHPTKVCTACKIDKYKSEYHKNSNRVIQSVCKDCKAAWYEENKSSIQDKYKKLWADDGLRARKKETNLKSRKKNREKQNLQKREYGKRPEVAQRKRDAHNKRKQTDSNYVIKRRLRGRVRDIVRRGIISPKGVKYKSSLVLLGCDVEFFKKYLESKFYDGMSWENISGWHIDHIKPCSKFDLSKFEDQKVCFHYSNLQPLFEKDNLEKSYLYEEPIPINSPALPHLIQMAV